MQRSYVSSVDECMPVVSSGILSGVLHNFSHRRLLGVKLGVVESGDGWRRSHEWKGTF